MSSRTNQTQSEGYQRAHAPPEDCNIFIQAFWMIHLYITRCTYRHPQLC